MVSKVESFIEFAHQNPGKMVRSLYKLMYDRYPLRCPFSKPKVSDPSSFVHIWTSPLNNFSFFPNSQIIMPIPNDMLIITTLLTAENSLGCDHCAGTLPRSWAFSSLDHKNVNLTQWHRSCQFSDANARPSFQWYQPYEPNPTSRPEPSIPWGLKLLLRHGDRSSVSRRDLSYQSWSRWSRSWARSSIFYDSLTS